MGTTLKNTCGTTRSAVVKLLVDVFFAYARRSDGTSNSFDVSTLRKVCRAQNTLGLYDKVHMHLVATGCEQMHESVSIYPTWILGHDTLFGGSKNRRNSNVPSAWQMPS